ncbi:MAG: glycosyltransferase [Actinomycetota bacterium]|nr:glycosyltransferase [Actinomycetota bacterium]
MSARRSACGAGRWGERESAAPPPRSERPRVDGKFLAVGDSRLWVKGVTYGTFAPDERGERFGSPEQVERDFAAMAEEGVNAVRTYTAPPAWVLDAALRQRLWVMVGLSWEQHVAFLDERGRAGAIEARVRSDAAACAGHPAVLCYAVGNEIPTPIVRWHGRARVQRFLERLCESVRSEDRGALLTYVNYPSTEYLRLPFVDLLSFNVYLDDAASVSRYLARLQNLAGEKPLLLAELGGDSLREGEHRQAEVIGSQVEAAFAAGCAGTFVFSWTDEWHRGGDEVLDWRFGVTDRARRPKAALPALRRAYAAAERGRPDDPHVSVVVCTRNGAATLADCLDGVVRLRYPSFELIVVDDGSTDASAQIAAAFGARVITTENRGLSAARNTGLEAARGEIVAYLDDDARPDQDWLRFLAATFRATTHAAVGGPNLPPPDDGGVATCVANAPGGPVHVLLSDTEAEHIPGCNMAYRRADLAAIDGFDPRFRIAGDDVDVCWRLQQRGSTLGFHPAATVWHRRRSSVRGFWRQQRGYGEAEALLERKWPERYNRHGHLSWRGRLYDRASVFRPTRIYHGTWGSGPFQPEEGTAPSRVSELARAPEWYLVLAALAGLSLLGTLWPSLLLAVPLLLVALAAPVREAVRAGLGAELGRHGSSRRRRLALRGLTGFLTFLQPAARLTGRLTEGLVPWAARPRLAAATLPRRLVRTLWFEQWRPAQERVAKIETSARRPGARVVRGGPYDRWDLELCAGVGAARLLVAVEEHGRGRQLVRCRVWPRASRATVTAVVVASGLACLAFFAAERTATAVLGALALGLVALTAWECGIAVAAASEAVAASAGDADARHPAHRLGGPQLHVLPSPRPKDA